MLTNLLPVVIPEQRQPVEFTLLELPQEQGRHQRTGLVVVVTAHLRVLQSLAVLHNYRLPKVLERLPRERPRNGPWNAMSARISQKLHSELVWIPLNSGAIHF